MPKQIYKAALWQHPHQRETDCYFVVPNEMDPVEVYLGNGKFNDRAICQATTWANAQLIAKALNEFRYGPRNALDGTSLAGRATAGEDANVSPASLPEQIPISNGPEKFFGER